MKKLIFLTFLLLIAMLGALTSKKETYVVCDKQFVPEHYVDTYYTVFVGGEQKKVTSVHIIPDTWYLVVCDDKGILGKFEVPYEKFSQYSIGDMYASLKTPIPMEDK